LPGGGFTFISERKRKFVYASLMRRNLYTGVEDAIMTFKFSGITSNGRNKRNKMTKNHTQVWIFETSHKDSEK
jgi:hypothetical protein